MEYNLLDLIAALEEVVKKAAPFPIGKKSLVDCTEIDEIATEMRLVLPREIQQAQNIVADKNRIISDAKKEAEAIISKAEQQRRELIDQNSILQEARRRATEEISAAQQRSNLIRSSTQDYTDKMLSRVADGQGRERAAYPPQDPQHWHGACKAAAAGAAPAGSAGSAEEVIRSARSANKSKPPFRTGKVVSLSKK